MTDRDKPDKPDPFAPLPLSETLTGPTKKRESGATALPQPPAAAPLPPTAFTRTSGEHDVSVQPFETYTPEPPVAPAWSPVTAPVDVAASEVPPPPVVPPPVAIESPPPPVIEPPVEAAWSEPAALAGPAPAALGVENELRDAVGVTQLPDAPVKKKKPAKARAASRGDDGDGDGDTENERPRSRLWMLAAALAIVVGGSVTAMILVGRANSERFVIACEADRVEILQGRSFPPWGESVLEGAEWKALKIPAEAPCTPLETESKAELAARFEKLLEERATKLVGGRGGTSTPTTAAGPDDPVAKVDEAEANLKQALLVSRHLASENERITKREDLERLLGDVTYWRASARLRAAADALADAAKQFDAAALQKPRTNTDAAGWAMHARRLADQLRAGPGGVQDPVFPPTPPGATPTPTTTAPPGVALPVEPPRVDVPAAEQTPDAGVPSGGVLL